MFRYSFFIGRVAVASSASLALCTTVAIASNDLTPPTFKLSYESAFVGYRPLGDLNVGSWRDANDTVTKVGGWREYLKEVQRATSPSPAAQQSAPAARSPTAVPTTAPITPTPAKPAPDDPHAAHRRPQ